MGRFTYHLNEAAMPPAEPMQMNMTFAALAAARASWAPLSGTSQEPNDDPAGAWGAPGEPLFDAVDEVEALWKHSRTTKAAHKASQPSGGSGSAQAPELQPPSPFATSRTFMAAPRSSLICRLLSESGEPLPVTNSLPPAVASAPSASEVADIAMTRHDHGVAFSTPPPPKRAASFSQLSFHGTSSQAAAEAQGEYWGSSRGGGGGDGDAGISRDGRSRNRYAPRRASCTDYHLTSVPEQGLPSALLGALGIPQFTTGGLTGGGGSSGAPSSMRDGDIDDVDGSGGEAGREGCLVLPVLRSLLELPRPGRGGGRLVACARPSTSSALLHANGPVCQGSPASPVRRSGGHGGGHSGSHSGGHSHGGREGSGVDVGPTSRRSLGLRPSPLAALGHDAEYDCDDETKDGGGRAPLALIKSHCSGSLAAAAIGSPGANRPGCGRHSPVRGLRSANGLDFVAFSGGPCGPCGPVSPILAPSVATPCGMVAAATLAPPPPPPGSLANVDGAAVRACANARFSWGASKVAAGGKWLGSSGVSGDSTTTAVAAATRSPDLRQPDVGGDGPASPNAEAHPPYRAEQRTKRRSSLTEPPPPPPLTQPAAVPHLIKGLASAAWVQPPPPRRASGVAAISPASGASAAEVDPINLGGVMGSGLLRALP